MHPAGQKPNQVTEVPEALLVQAAVNFAEHLPKSNTENWVVNRADPTAVTRVVTHFYASSGSFISEQQFEMIQSRTIKAEDEDDPLFNFVPQSGYDGSVEREFIFEATMSWGYDFRIFDAKTGLLLAEGYWDEGWHDSPRWESVARMEELLLAFMAWGRGQANAADIEEARKVERYYS